MVGQISFCSLIIRHRWDWAHQQADLACRLKLVYLCSRQLHKVLSMWRSYLRHQLQLCINNFVQLHAFYLLFYRVMIQKNLILLLAKVP